MQMSQESDYLCWDQTEVLHWTSRRRAAAGGDMTATIHHVRRHMVGVKEAATSGGAYSSGDVLFFVPAAVLPESIGEPKMADWIADDQGVRYTALSVDHRRRDSKRVQTYKVQARDLTIVFELLDIITIETPVTVLDTTGAEKVTGWVAKYPDLPARVQKLTEDIAEERGIRGFEGKYTVTVDREVVVTLHDRVKYTVGESVKYLDVMGYRNAERIDELPALDCRDAV